MGAGRDQGRRNSQALIVSAASYCPDVGESKRHAAYCAKRMDEQMEEFVIREELIMLTAAELDVENCQPTNFSEPRKVYAHLPGRTY
jgi:hypothetical protein